MKLTSKKFEEIKKLQEGGEMTPPTEAPANGGAPAPEDQGGGDPMEQLIQAAAQAVQTQDAQLALQVCQVLVESAGGGAQAPAEAPGQPVFRKGGKLSRWI